MNQRIIFPQETGIAVITPTGELSVEETALKDVPTGVKYKIIDVSDLPPDTNLNIAAFASVCLVNGDPSTLIVFLSAVD